MKNQFGFCESVGEDFFLSMVAFSHTELLTVKLDVIFRQKEKGTPWSF